MYTNKNGVESKKNVTTKKTIKDGKIVEETTQDYMLPSGVREITKTIKDGDKVTTKKYELKRGDELPKELTNWWIEADLIHSFVYLFCLSLFFHRLLAGKDEVF